MSDKFKLFLIAMVLAIIARCATVSDCSRFPASSSVRCACIEENGDFLRARRCNKKLITKMLEKKTKECLKRCFGDNCDELCKQL